jgi:hypothetical protein
MSLKDGEVLGKLRRLDITVGPGLVDKISSTRIRAG